jgi:hypothetical protein
MIITIYFERTPNDIEINPEEIMIMFGGLLRCG